MKKYDSALAISKGEIKQKIRGFQNKYTGIFNNVRRRDPNHALHHIQSKTIWHYFQSRNNAKGGNRNSYEKRNSSLELGDVEQLESLSTKHLKGTDYDGLADPFVRLQLVPVQNKADKLRTRTVHKTLNPEFNETVAFFGMTDYDFSKRVLKLTVMDEDPFGNDFLGETHLSLKKVRPYHSKHFHVYLDKAFELEDGEDDISSGRVLLSLMYSSEHHALIVGVLRCIQLPPRDNHSTGYYDPYVKIVLKPDSLRRRYKTATKKKTLNPEYNEEFVFEVKPHEMGKKTLEIAVWNKDYGKADDYIGGLALGIQSKGDRLRHWVDMIGNPDRRIERWHPLSDTIILD